MCTYIFFLYNSAWRYFIARFRWSLACRVLSVLNSVEQTDVTCGRRKGLGGLEELVLLLPSPMAPDGKQVKCYSLDEGSAVTGSLLLSLGFVRQVTSHEQAYYSPGNVATKSVG